MADDRMAYTFLRFRPLTAFAVNGVFNSQNKATYETYILVVCRIVKVISFQFFEFFFKKGVAFKILCIFAAQSTFKL